MPRFLMVINCTVADAVSTLAHNSTLARPSISSTAVQLLHDLWPTIAAIVAAGWILYLYVRQRSHAQRLKLNVSASLVSKSDHARLDISFSATNIGKTRVPIMKSGTAVRVFTPPAQARQEWVHYGSRHILEDQVAIEPEETVTENLITYLPEPAPTAVQITVEVNGTKAAWITRVTAPLVTRDDQLRS